MNNLVYILDQRFYAAIRKLLTKKPEMDTDVKLGNLIVRFNTLTDEFAGLVREGYSVLNGGNITREQASVIYTNEAVYETKYTEEVNALIDEVNKMAEAENTADMSALIEGVNEMVDAEAEEEVEA
ncbi:MAG: hypothetical protein WAX89_05665 [Alphaproteobacteria bacterium]